MIRKIATSMMASLMALTISHAHALDYSINGFMTLAAGQIIKSEKNNPPYLNYNCPCYITDYNQAGLYEGQSASLLPDSKIGLQSTLFFTPELSFTGQIVARAVDGDTTLEWAYLSYRIADEWTIQLGRKRLPIYFYSDFQDVGNAFIMIRPQQALYGWEVSNYNGASLLYQDYWQNWSVSGSVYGGSEEVKDSGYQRLYDTVNQNVKWNNIIGTEWTFSYDWFTTRITYMQSDNFATSKPYENGYSTKPIKQEITGIALNADFGNWFILSEFNNNERNQASTLLDIESPATSIGAGYRFGSFTAFANHSRYIDKSEDYSVYEPERWSDTSFTLRYDIDPGSDVKIQIDQFRDNAFYDFVGDSTLLTVSYDLVF